MIVRFCPLLFKREPEDEPFIDLPYIVCFAVATLDQVLIYTTRSLVPFAAVSNIHLAELTDLAWMGREKLLVSSREGFVTNIMFEEGELGT